MLYKINKIIIASTVWHIVKQFILQRPKNLDYLEWHVGVKNLALCQNLGQ